jgi:hypothetical protein
MHRAFRFAVASLLVLLPPDTARATSCTVGLGCHPLAIQAAMFLGEALSVRNALVQITPFPCIFRFRVIESFSSSPRPGEEIEVSGSRDGGGCGSSQFEIGQHYLVDAFDYDAPQDVRLSTSVCSNTRPESEATLALAELRARASGGRIPDLNGQVNTIEGFDTLGTDQYKPLTNVTVTITSVNGATTLHTLTDSAGIYSFTTLPPGDYSVAFDGLPPHRVAMRLEHGPFDFTIAILESGGDGASCHLNAFAAPSGGITGQMVDASGTGVEGVVFAYLGDHPGRDSLAASSVADKQGHFTLNFLRDGDYLIQYSGLTTSKYIVTHVTVGDGQTTTGVQLRLPTP